MQITADVSKILKTPQGDLTFIFASLSESLFGFLSYLVFQSVENVVSFTKKRFYRKRDSLTILNYAETLQATFGQNMEYTFLTKQLSCRKYTFVTIPPTPNLPSKCHNSKTCGSTTPRSYIFLNLLHCLYQIRYR